MSKEKAIRYAALANFSQQRMGIVPDSVLTELSNLWDELSLKRKLEYPGSGWSSADLTAWGIYRSGAMARYFIPASDGNAGDRLLYPCGQFQVPIIKQTWRTPRIAIHETRIPQRG